MIYNIKITDMHEASLIADGSGRVDHNYTAWVTLLGRSDQYVCERIKKDFHKKGVIHFHRYFEDIADGPLADSHGPSKEDVEYIIDFFETLKVSSKDHFIGINCYAGVSRSTAAGIIGYMVQGYAPEIAIEKIFNVRRMAQPNQRMLEFYDDIKGTNSQEIISDWNKATKGKLLTNPAWNTD